MTVAQPNAGGSQTLSDEEIVGRVRAGELALFELLMRRHNQTLYRAVRAILREESEIEDVLQEAYWAAFRSLAEFGSRARFSTWLVRIAINKALDLRRRRTLASALFGPDADELPRGGARAWARTREDPEHTSARRELARALEQAIDALPELFRGVYVLRDLEGMSTEETAESLGLEPATVRTRLHRARSLLRERLAGDFDAAALRAFPFGAERCDRVVSATLARVGQGGP